jgi:hypothetical protein
MSAALRGRVVTAHVWRLRTRHGGFGPLCAAAPSALLARRVGAQFIRVLGTARGEQMTPRAIAPTTWAVIASWTDQAAAARYEGGRFVAGWARRSAEAARLVLRPLRSRGRWGASSPFEPLDSGHAGAAGGSVAAITRARIAVPALRAFWGSVPPIAGQLSAASGCRAAIGIGEAPLLWQGTLSVWDDADALRGFAYAAGAHAQAVDRTPAAGWYAQELFARFAVLEAAGSIGGAPIAGPIGGRSDGAVDGAAA